jgi:hypothetical protein
VTVHSAADLVYRDFENGLVLANPSPHKATFDLASLFRNARFRRLRGSKHQDPQTNNGQMVGPRLTLPARDAVFLIRIPAED